MENKNRFSSIRLTIAISLTLLVALAVFLLYKYKYQPASCAPIYSKEYFGYKEPCIVDVRLAGPEPYASQSTLEKALKPIDGTFNGTQLPEFGIYYVKVKASTAQKSIEYLQKLPFVESASQGPHLGVTAD